MVELLLAVVAGLLAVAVTLLLQLRSRRAATASVEAGLESLERADERTERAVREELAKNREEAIGSARHLREELSSSVKVLGDSLLQAGGRNATTQKEQLDSFSRQLHLLTQANESRLAEVRGAVETGLEKLRQAHDAKLDQMRATVDEKLQGTLEKRLGAAFSQVSERLEAVHKGLGEMQSLANGVGDLKKVLTNVKARGTWGEIQLGELLSSVLTSEQYEKNVATKPGSADRVEFAIKLPGGDEDARETIWLPIDAKFPQEDYHRLIEAEERADGAAAETARRALAARVRDEAKKIRGKYVDPPHTTDFALLYLPTEGLYAEVLRGPGLVERLQQEHRVVVAGPTTLAALLNSLQMGFRTLAIQQRSSEVWKLLGAVKTQFGKFSELLEGVQRKLDQAATQLESASRRSRTIERKLGKVEELPNTEARELLPELEAAPAPDDATASS